MGLNFDGIRGINLVDFPLSDKKNNFPGSSLPTPWLPDFEETQSPFFWQVPRKMHSRNKKTYSKFGTWFVM